MLSYFRCYLKYDLYYQSFYLLAAQQSNISLRGENNLQKIVIMTVPAPCFMYRS